MNLYQQNILDHYKNPRNFVNIEPSGYLKGTENNFSCGDSITFFVKIKNNKVVDSCFTGEGCSLAVGAASILTEAVKGKSIEELKILNSDNFKKLLGLVLSPNREKCALLCLKAFNKAIRP